MSLASIQIQSRDYLLTQKHVSPNINDYMLVLAGQTFHNVDLNNLSGDGYLNFKGCLWRPEWFTVLDREAKLLTEQQLNLPQTFKTLLNGQDFPEELEYIKIVSKKVSTPKEIEISHFKVSLEYAEDRTQMYMKFKGATAYNVSQYLRMSTRRMEHSAGDIVDFFGGTRNKELLVAKTIQALHNAVQSWTNIYSQAKNTLIFSNESDIVFYHEGRFDALGFDETTALRFVLVSLLGGHTYDFATIALFLTIVFTANLLSVGVDKMLTWNDIDLLNPPFDDSKVYIKTHGGLHPVDRAAIEGFRPVVKSNIFGFYMLAQQGNVEQTLFGMKFQKRFCRVSQKNVFNPFDASLEDLFKRAQSHGYIDRYPAVGVLYKGDVYHPDAIEIVKEREELLESLGISTRGSLYAQHEVEEYDFEPDITFFGDSSEPYFGVELEVDRGGIDPDLSIIEKVLGVDFAYYMRDGSLDDGFEIATMPATLDYHMNHKRRYETAFKLLGEQGYRSHDTSTCGLHIHFDRTALGSSRTTQNLKASFLALILEKNWNQIIKFSRRDFRRLEHWAKNQKLVADIYHDDDNTSVVRKFNNKYNNGDKYNALNCNHSHTFELRIFRGTLKANTYLATLQFVSNLVSIARECKTLDQAQRIKFEDIINYKPYDELNAYIEERNLNLEGGEQ